MAHAPTTHGHADHTHNPYETHPHVAPLSTYLAVFGVLLVLTVVTVWVSTLGLPSTTSILVAMAVAVVKGTLVIFYFMHLKDDVKFHWVVLGSAFWFLAIFFGFTLIDLDSRGMVNPIQDNGVPGQAKSYSGEGGHHDAEVKPGAAPADHEKAGGNTHADPHAGDGHGAGGH